MNSNESIEVRRATRDDLGAILAVHASASGIPHRSLADFETELHSERSMFAVAAARGRIVGYAIARIVEPEAELHMIAVRPESGRLGYGTRMLEYVLGEVRRRGCAVIRLEVGAQNAAALKFYERGGFRIVGRRAKYYNDGSDALLMDMQLK